MGHLEGEEPGVPLSQFLRVAEAGKVVETSGAASGLIEWRDGLVDPGPVSPRVIRARWDERPRTGLHTDDLVGVQ